ncbi:MAG TPA: VOC family protein [Polyangiaceae bacterium]
MSAEQAANHGVLGLGYLGFEVSAPDAWQSFALDVLGLELAGELPGGGFDLRMDSHARRLFVEPGPADDVSVIGWQVADAAALERLAKELEAAGYAVSSGSREEASRRSVAALVKFRDPAGIPSELFYGPERGARPFQSTVLASHFVAEQSGLGHVVVTSKDKRESVDFYTRVLGFRLSDHVVCRYFGHDVDISFFHANRRHHSVAIGGPQPKRIHHFLLEVGLMDDVGMCFDRALRSGVPIMNTLGRHPNDRMFSFYAQTPSGIQFEFGWGGREVDDASWEPVTHGRISEWGHHPPGVFAPRKKPPEKGNP